MLSCLVLSCLVLSCLVLCCVVLSYTHSLELQNNKIGSAGALMFADVLNSDIKNAIGTLDVSNNNIGDAGGAALQKLADEKKSIGNLVIHGNRIGQCDCKLCVLAPDADRDHWSYNIGVEEGVFVEIDDNGGLVTTSTVDVDYVDWEAIEEEEKRKEWERIAPKLETGNEKLKKMLEHEAEVERKRKIEIELERGREERERIEAEKERRRRKDLEDKKKGLNNKVGAIQAAMYGAEDEVRVPIGVEASVIDDMFGRLTLENNEREKRTKAAEDEKLKKKAEQIRLKEENEMTNTNNVVVVVEPTRDEEKEKREKEEKLKAIAEKPINRRISIKEMIAMSEKASDVSQHIREHKY